LCLINDCPTFDALSKSDGASELSLSDRKIELRAERDQLILNIATQIIQAEGFAGLNMQRIADQTRYSKGTIYQHYGSKEDIVAALVVQCGRRLLSLLDIASQQSGSIRCKVGLISAAFFINAASNASVVALVPTVKSPAFMQKVNPEHAALLTDIDDQILQHIVDIFAQDANFTHTSPLQAAFGWWAMQWGTQDVMGKGWDLARLGINNPVLYYYQSLQIYLDGLGVEKDLVWQDWGATLTAAQSIFKASLN
jgi:AcrR family transcriptional regulator